MLKSRYKALLPSVQLLFNVRTQQFRYSPIRFTTNTPSDSTITKLKQDGIIPDVLPETAIPEQELQVKYNNITITTPGIEIAPNKVTAF